MLVSNQTSRTPIKLYGHSNTRAIFVSMFCNKISEFIHSWASSYVHWFQILQEQKQNSFLSLYRRTSGQVRLLLEKMFKLVCVRSRLTVTRIISYG